MQPTDKEVVFDVYTAHTKHCQYCLTALKNLKKIRFGLICMSVLVATIRPTVLGMIGSVVTTSAFAGLADLMYKLIGMFIRHEFSQVDNH